MGKGTNRALLKIDTCLCRIRMSLGRVRCGEVLGRLEVGHPMRSESHRLCENGGEEEAKENPLEHFESVAAHHCGLQAFRACRGIPVVVARRVSGCPLRMRRSLRIHNTGLIA